MMVPVEEIGEGKETHERALVFVVLFFRGSTSHTLLYPPSPSVFFCTALGFSWVHDYANNHRTSHAKTVCREYYYFTFDKYNV
jgi:hypothetical protein